MQHHSQPLLAVPRWAGTGLMRVNSTGEYLALARRECKLDHSVDSS
jgi:hypothetical protein